MMCYNCRGTFEELKLKLLLVWKSLHPIIGVSYLHFKEKLFELENMDFHFLPKSLDSFPLKVYIFPCCLYDGTSGAKQKKKRPSTLLVGVEICIKNQKFGSWLVRFRVKFLHVLLSQYLIWEGENHKQSMNLDVTWTSLGKELFETIVLALHCHLRRAGMV